MELTKAVLPEMIARKDGRIVMMLQSLAIWWQTRAKRRTP